MQAERGGRGGLPSQRARTSVSIMITSGITFPSTLASPSRRLYSPRAAPVRFALLSVRSAARSACLCRSPLATFLLVPSLSTLLSPLLSLPFFFSPPSFFSFPLLTSLLSLPRSFFPLTSPFLCSCFLPSPHPFLPPRSTSPFFSPSPFSLHFLPPLSPAHSTYPAPAPLRPCPQLG